MNIRIDKALNILLENEETPLPEETEATSFTVGTTDVSDDFARMNNSMHLTMILAPILIFVVFAGFFFLVGKMIFSPIKRYKVLRKGVVVDKQQNARRFLTYDVEFEYMFRGMTYRACSRWPVSLMHSLRYLPVGKEVTIHVNPDDPTDIYWGRNLFDPAKWEDEYGNRI